MEGLSALKMQMDQLAKKHSQYYYKVIWMDQKVQNEDEFMDSLSALVDFNKLNKLLESLWINGLDKVNKIMFNNGLKNLIRAREGIIKTMISDYKKSKSENDEIFGKYISQIYELLTTIFQNTTCNEKNLYFHTLVDYYYLQLSEKLEKAMKLNIARLLPVAAFEQQIKIFLPIAKLDKMIYISAGLETTEDTKLRLLKPFVLEIYEYFKYPHFLREDCLKILEDHVGPYSYKLIKFKLISETLDDLYKLNIVYNRDEKEEILSLLVKHNSESTSAINFAREEFFYSILVPRVARYVSYDHLNFVSKCYFVRTEDILVLDDFSSKIEIRNLEEFPDAVLKQLAKLHACSFILKKLNGSLRKEFENNFKKSSESDLAKHNANLVTDFILEKFPDIPIKKNTDMAEFREITKSLVNEMFKNLQKSNVIPSVICHGNLRRSSIVLKKDDHSDIKHCYLINYESLKYCSPVLDLLFFLYSNTTREFRNKSMSNLLRKYYEDLANNLKQYNVDIKDMFNFGTFLESWSYFKQTALCMCLCPGEFLEAVPKKMPTVKEFNELLIRDGLSESCLKELVEELYEVYEKQHQ